MICLQLFLAFLQIGAFSFGGGYAAMPLIEEQVISTYHWMTMADFSDLVTIAEMTPGPIAVNAATFVGNQAAGIPGALIATLGVILPSCIFVTVLAWVYKKYRKLSMVQPEDPDPRALCKRCGELCLRKLSGPDLPILSLWSHRPAEV